jgi:hypothetical protein
LGVALQKQRKSIRKAKVKEISSTEPLHGKISSTRLLNVYLVSTVRRQKARKSFCNKVCKVGIQGAFLGDYAGALGYSSPQIPIFFGTK